MKVEVVATGRAMEQNRRSGHCGGQEDDRWAEEATEPVGEGHGLGTLWGVKTLERRPSGAKARPLLWSLCTG
jgi:hypothetical protein